MIPHDRRERDPLWLHQVRARLARIRIAKAARETEAVAAAWPPDENILERIYLARHAAAPPVERKEERA